MFLKSTEREERGMRRGRNKVSACERLKIQAVTKRAERHSRISMHRLKFSMPIK